MKAMILCVLLCTMFCIAFAQEKPLSMISDFESPDDLKKLNQGDSGQIELSFNVPDKPLLEGIEMVLQSACSREVAGGGRSLECVSNPLLIRVLPAECDPRAP